ncbi:hypothetical protein QWY85_17250 [Neolewinella lacunae]|uniref:Uncharacterized protein n=1 Tax=Neolewinella lacunae TaxID=1517758 RepID=A0A923TEG6_9BACT|nr:hypothetical protein [Neolewinella lacunae]MBC6995892.1 hypothetical protein [Neolewinella lacunae]MDN3636416.1 hypothetical protein [Neolewinella lacunae]
MLTTLTLIRSCTYDLAELDFRHGQAMQLVGGNNVGKSSLIYALNFLFVINRKRMSFMGRKAADKTTMEYYFPEAEGSFIVFEISKRGRTYCIVVWRDGEGNPNYARLHHGYQRELFFDTAPDGGLQPRKLIALKKKWVQDGIKLEELRNQRDIFKTIYHTGRANDAAVWLKASGHGRAAEGFSKLYRYLIDTRLIDMPALREILLLADHREDSALQYGKNNLADVDRLRRLQSRVETLRGVEGEFATFRDNYHSLQEGEERLALLALHFQHHSTRIRADIQAGKGRHEQDLQETQALLDTAEREWKRANQAVGAARTTLGLHLGQLAKQEQQLAEIAALPDVEFLRLGEENLREGIDSIRLQLSELKQSPHTVAELEDQLRRNARQLQERQGQRENIGNWLILHLAADEQDRRRLSAILSQTVARSDAAALRTAISSTEGLVRLFDGVFALPENLELPDLPSPEALDREIAELRQSRQRTERLLKTAQNRAAVEAELQQKEAQLRNLSKQLELRKSEPEVVAAIAELRSTIVHTEAELATAEKDAGQNAETMRRTQEALQILQRQHEARERDLNKIHAQLRKLEGFQIETTNFEYLPRPLPDGGLDGVFNALEKGYQDQRLLGNQVHTQFRQLRTQLLSETASEAAFIEEVTGEFAGMEDQAVAIQSLVDNISHRFANPAADLLNEYQKFSEFISKQFNRSLANHQISNIEQLRIELIHNDQLRSDLQKISGLDLGGNLFQRDGGGMKVLKRYIEQGRDILFSDLFTLQLKLTVNGKEKTVDLSKQIESDGTDRMLRLIIVMHVISRLAELGPENRVVVFIDEIATIDGKNRPQLVRFCAENHFYPIFAAPEMVEGFDRYVMISRAADRSLVVDRNKHYIDAERS